MSEQDTEQVSDPDRPEPTTPVRPESGGRPDDRNEGVDQPPMPDPETGSTEDEDTSAV